MAFRTSSFAGIKGVLLDVDGVLTDGGVYYSDRGDELKKFNIQDGYGIVKAIRMGIKVGIITGRVSTIVAKRAKELGITDVHQTLEKKVLAYEEILKGWGIPESSIVYIGDDEPDLPVMARVGIAAAPVDAVPAVLKQADYICKRAGGHGAVREVLDMILEAKGHGRRRPA